MAHRFWPVFDLTIRTERLVLRVPTEEDFGGLIDAIDAGIHPPEYMPFQRPWTDAEPKQRALNAARHWWQIRADWKPDDWHLSMAIFVDGHPIGIQAMLARDFSVMREVSTGSWMTEAAQGRGYGKEARLGVLQLAFEGLGAEIARSAARTDNHSSLGVSRALGYVDDGTMRQAPRGEPVDVIRLLMTREQWFAVNRPRAEIEHLDPALEHFGV